MSKYMFDDRSWEDAGRSVAQLNDLAAGAKTRDQAEHHIREFLADEYFRRSKERRDKPRFPKGAAFWGGAMASCPRVQGWAKRYREIAFQQLDAPFRSTREAYIWLQKQKRASERAATQDNAKMKSEEWTHWRDAIPTHPPGMPVVVRRERLLVEFLSRDGRLDTIYAHTKQLAAVARGAEYVCEITGWPRALGTAYILTGEFPVNSFGALIWHAGASVPWIEARLYPAALNAATFNHLLHLARTRIVDLLDDLPNGRDATLLDIMQEIGWPPEGRGRGTGVGLTQYWMRVAKRWNRLHAKDRVNADALRKRWERMNGNFKARAKSHFEVRSSHTTK